MPVYIRLAKQLFGKQGTRLCAMACPNSTLTMSALSVERVILATAVKVAAKHITVDLLANETTGRRNTRASAGSCERPKQGKRDFVFQERVGLVRQHDFWGDRMLGMRKRRKQLNLFSITLCGGRVV